MSNVKILFGERGGNPTIALASSEMVEARNGAWTDYFGRLQSLYRFYGTMTMTNTGKHTINSIVGNPLMVRAKAHCTWSPDKGFKNGALVIEPSELEIEQEVCLGQDFSAAFKIFEAYQNNDPATVPAALVDQFFQEAGFAIGRGSRFHGAVGGLHSATAAKAGTDADTVALWAKARNAHKGWAKLFLDNAGANPHLNVATFADPADVTAGKVTKSFTEIYDTAIAAATPQFATVLDIGAVYTPNGENRVCVTVSPAYYALARKAELAENSITAVNKPRYSREIVDGTSVLMIDGHPIILEDTFGYADAITGKTTYAMAIAPAEVIALGTSFVDNTLLFDKEAGAGLVVEYGQNLKDKGKILMAGDQLISTVLSDTDYIVGSVAIVDEPA